MAKSTVAPAASAATPYEIWAKTPRPINDGMFAASGPFDAEPFEQEHSFEVVLARAAQINRIARLMLIGYSHEETEEDGDSALLKHVLWAESLCLRRAIKLHNDRVQSISVSKAVA